MPHNENNAGGGSIQAAHAVKVVNIIVATDCVDFASSEIKMSLLSSLKNYGIECSIEIVHSKPFSIENAAFIIRQLAECSPPGTVFFPVVNAERSQQARVVGRTLNGFVYVGRATGALDWLISDFGSIEHYEVVGIPFQPFGGRSIYPNILAAYLSDKLEKFETKRSECSVDARRTSGRIVHIDNFGNCKIHSYLKEGTSEWAPQFIQVNRLRTLQAIRCTRVMDAPLNTLLIYPGSSLRGLAELAVNRGNAALDFNLSVGDLVEILNP